MDVSDPVLLVVFTLIIGGWRLYGLMDTVPLSISKCETLRGSKKIDQEMN